MTDLNHCTNSGPVRQGMNKNRTILSQLWHNLLIVCTVCAIVLSGMQVWILLVTFSLLIFFFFFFTCAYISIKQTLKNQVKSHKYYNLKFTVKFTVYIYIYIYILLYTIYYIYIYIYTYIYYIYFEQTWKNQVKIHKHLKLKFFKLL